MIQSDYVWFNVTKYDFFLYIISYKSWELSEAWKIVELKNVWKFPSFRIYRWVCYHDQLFNPSRKIIFGLDWIPHTQKWKKVELKKKIQADLLFPSGDLASIRYNNAQRKSKTKWCFVLQLLVPNISMFLRWRSKGSIWSSPLKKFTM